MSLREAVAGMMAPSLVRQPPSPALETAVVMSPVRRYTLERFRSRFTLDLASLKRVPPHRSSGGDPSSGLLAALAAQGLAQSSVLGPELERARRSFQAEVTAKLRKQQQADLARQDAWLLAQQGRPGGHDDEVAAGRPFAWQAVVSPVQVTPLADDDTRLRSSSWLGGGDPERRDYELVAYGSAFVLPEDVPLVEALAASRHTTVHAPQFPLTITPKLLLDDPLLEARRLAYEEYVAFVERLTGSAAAAETREPTPPADVDQSLEQILSLWNQQQDALVAQYAPLIKNTAGRGRLRSS